MSDNRAPDYADKIAAELLAEHPAVVSLFTSSELELVRTLMRVAGTGGYALGLGVSS